MRHWIHYLLATAWGLATPVLMGWGSQEIIEFFTSGKERLGHSTPVEFFLLFLVYSRLFTMELQRKCVRQAVLFLQCSTSLLRLQRHKRQ